MPSKTYTPAEKAHILARVSEIGAAAAAKEAGASYQSVLRWVKEGKDTVKDGMEKIAALPGEMVEKVNAEIAAKEEEISNLEEDLKARKRELKELQKAKAKAEKQKEAFEKAEEKKRVVEAVMKSEKSVDEILSFLKK